MDEYDEMPVARRIREAAERFAQGLAALQPMLQPRVAEDPPVTKRDVDGAGEPFTYAPEMEMSGGPLFSGNWIREDEVLRREKALHDELGDVHAEVASLRHERAEWKTQLIEERHARQAVQLRRVAERAEHVDERDRLGKENAILAEQRDHHGRMREYAEDRLRRVRDVVNDDDVVDACVAEPEDSATDEQMDGERTATSTRGGVPGTLTTWFANEVAFANKHEPGR